MLPPIEHLPARGVAEAHEFCIRLKIGPSYERGLPITGFRFSNNFSCNFSLPVTIFFLLTIM